MKIVLEEIRTDEHGRQYMYKEFEKTFANGLPYYEKRYLPNEQDLSFKREVNELNAWLDLYRNVDHPDKATKQARLLELLG